MTPGEFTSFLEGRVAEWYRHEESGWKRGRRISLLEYLGMLADEYASWVLTSIPPDRIWRIWKKQPG